MMNILQGNCGNEPTAITNIPTTTLPVSEPETEPEPEPVTTPGPVVTPITEEGETPSTGVTPEVTPGVSIPYSVETTPGPVVTPTAPGEPTTGIKPCTFPPCLQYMYFYCLSLQASTSCRFCHTKI